MRSSNRIILIVALIIAVLLLALWYFLGFDKVDSPLDLVLFCCWCVLICVASALIANREKVRREAVNTCYLAPMKLYNSEKGLQDLVAGESPVARIQQVLEGLEYNFHMEPFPGDQDEEGNQTEKIDFVYVVRTKKFKVKDQDNANGEGQQQPDQGQQKEVSWEGEVAVVARPNDDPKPFSSREELLAILEGPTPAAAA